jgi:hypothetical protein
MGGMEKEFKSIQDELAHWKAEYNRLFITNEEHTALIEIINNALRDDKINTLIALEAVSRNLLFSDIIHEALDEFIGSHNLRVKHAKREE